MIITAGAQSELAAEPRWHPRADSSAAFVLVLASLETSLETSSHWLGGRHIHHGQVSGPGVEPVLTWELEPSLDCRDGTGKQVLFPH